MPNSYNGWPADPSPSAIGINIGYAILGAKPFASGGFPGGVKSGDVQKAFDYLIKALHTRVEPMMKDPSSGKLGYGCWGYGYRANVNNPSQLSCHASGTAIDYNAPKHPNGTIAANNFSPMQIAEVRKILAELGGCIRWLSGNDPMHFEIFGTPAQVKAAVAQLPGSPPVVDRWWGWFKK